MMPTQAEITSRIKQLIVRRLRSKITEEDLSNDRPLFSTEEGSLGLDSVAALEIAVGLEHEFMIHIDESEEAIEHFYSVATLTTYVQALLEEKANRFKQSPGKAG